MYLITTEGSFSSAHFLKDYEGKCANIHGHRWKVVATIRAERLDDNGHSRGMIVDFNQIKKDLKDITDLYDHAFIVEKQTLQSDTFECLKRDGFKILEIDFRPTAENLSYVFYQKLKSLGYDLESVTVFETPKNSATYKE